MSENLFAPWLDHFGSVPSRLEYVSGSLWNAVLRTAEAHPHRIAYDFMGKKTSYRRFSREVVRCAQALRALGVREGDRVVICLPNCPQAVVLFYAVNAIRALSVMIHPLSGEKEIEFYLRDSESRVAVTLEQFQDKISGLRETTPLETLIVTSPADSLPVLNLFLRTTQLLCLDFPRKQKPGILLWKRFLSLAKGTPFLSEEGRSEDAAVILYSGGTTGSPKGILLSNGNFNALAQQIRAVNPAFSPGDRMLAVMPVFHGFGLGISIHSMLFNGGRCLLVPRFTVKSYGKLLRRKRCQYIAGVPTLYEALLRESAAEGADLSSLKGVFCGGDSLSVSLKERFDEFLRRHGASVEIREGYGTTECVTASCLMPEGVKKPGSMGIPFPDTYYKIVRPGTEEEVPYGVEGEICLAGPTVMLGYWNRPEETARILRRHPDGRNWVHTGDLGVMDGDGFLYFRQRLKRVIVTSGYNVYPSQVERALDDLDCVQTCCVIGVPDPLRGQLVKAFVVLRPGVSASEETKARILEHCRQYVAKYALPRQIEFREDLPKTLVGKVAYRQLEEETAGNPPAEGE